MSDITTPRSPTWRPSGRVRAAAMNPADPNQVLMAWSSGYVTGKNGARLPTPSNPAISLNPGETVMDIAVTNWSTPAGYLFTNKGRITSFGGAPVHASMVEMKDKIKGGKAIAFAMNPAQDGSGYWINAHGELFAFGDVPELLTTNEQKWVTRFMDPICQGWAFDWDTSRYILLASTGQLVPSPLAVNDPITTDAQRWLVWEKYARGLTYNFETGEGYVIDGHGGLYNVGNATKLTADPYWPQWDIARRILIASWGAEDTFRYHIVDTNGALHTRIRSEKPTVALVTPEGTRGVYNLTTTDAVGTLRLGWGTATSKGFAYRSTVDQLATVLDDLLGEGAYTITDNGASPELDVDIEFTRATELDPLVIRTDDTGAASITEDTAGVDPVLTDTSRPTFSWVYTDAEDDIQGAWEIQVWEAGGSMPSEPPDVSTELIEPVWFDSGYSDTVRSVQCAERLDNSTSYRAYLRAQERNGLWSDWAYLDFSLNLTLPLVPDATVAALPAEAAIELELDQDDIDADTTNEEARTRLWWERQRDGESSWETVRSSGQTIRQAGFRDRFDRVDADDLGAPWTKVTASGISGDLGIRSERAEGLPLSSSLELDRLVVAGSTWSGDDVMDLRNRIPTKGKRRITWSAPATPFPEGGAHFVDEFDRTDATTLGDADDGTEWIDSITNTWQTFNGYAAPVNYGDDAEGRNIALFETNQNNGGIQVKFRVGTGWETHVSTKVMSLALGTDDQGAGYWLDFEMNTNTGGWNWYLRFRDDDGTESVESSTSGSLGTGTFWGHDILLSAYLDAEAGELYASFTTFDFDDDTTVVESEVWAVSSLTVPDDGDHFGTGTRDTYPIGGLWWDRIQYARSAVVPDSVDVTATGLPVGTDGGLIGFGYPATVGWDMEPDTTMTVEVPRGLYFGALFARSYLDLSNDPIWLGHSVGDTNPKIAQGNTLLGYIPDLLDHTGKVSLQCSSNWVRVFKDNVPVPILAGPEVEADLTTPGDWTGSSCTVGFFGSDMTLTSTGGAMSVESNKQTTDIDNSLSNTVAVKWSAQVASGTMNARAYIAFYNGASTVVEVFIGPTVELDSSGDADLYCESIVPSGCDRVAYGLMLDGGVDTVVSACETGPVMAVHTSLTDGTLWGVNATPSGEPAVGAVDFDTVVAAAGADVDDIGAWGPDHLLATGTSPELAHGELATAVKVAPILTETDGAVVSWKGFESPDFNQTDQEDAIEAAIAWLRCRVRGSWLDDSTGAWNEIGTTLPLTFSANGRQGLADAAGAHFSRGVLSTWETAHPSPEQTLTIPPIEAGETLYVGITKVHGAGDIDIEYQDGGTQHLLEPAEANGTRPTAYNVQGTPKVIAVPVEANASTQDIVVSSDNQAVVVDWWGIAPAAPPMVAVLGGEDFVGTTDASDALETAAGRFTDGRVVFREVTAEEAATDQGPATAALEALVAPSSTQYAATAAVLSLEPNIIATVGLGGLVFCGLDPDPANPLIPNQMVAATAVESGTAPGTIAFTIIRYIDGAVSYPATIETGEALADGAPIELTFSDYHSGTPGLLTGVQALAPGAWIENVAIGSSTATFKDYEAIPGVTYAYRIRTSSSDGEIFSAPVEVGSATAPVVGYWLKDPENPDRNMRILREDDDFSWSREEPQGVFDQIPGRSTAIVVSGVVKNDTLGSHAIAVKGEAELERLMTLLDSGNTLLYQSPRTRQWYVRFGPEVETTSIVDAILDGDELFRVSLPDAVSVSVP